MFPRVLKHYITLYYITLLWYFATCTVYIYVRLSGTLHKDVRTLRKSFAAPPEHHVPIVHCPVEH